MRRVFALCFAVVACAGAPPPGGGKTAATDSEHESLRAPVLPTPNPAGPPPGVPGVNGKGAPRVAARPAAPPPSPNAGPASLLVAAPAPGTWIVTGSMETDLGPLNCYSQAELDACAAGGEKVPSHPCAVGAVATALLFVGMNCKNCFTDCYCRATVTTYACR